ncbi:MAG: hypothetical protein GY820_04565 [Gammaproteobacteria bacterium]|nr:hypothetical protein [Gammaproteobacteria bacterium]
MGQIFLSWLDPMGRGKAPPPGYATDSDNSPRKSVKDAQSFHGYSRATQNSISCKVAPPQVL